MNLTKIKTEEYGYEDYTLSSFKDPSNYYIFNASGNRLYIKTTDRATAQSKADEMYGKGFYTVRVVSDKDDLSGKKWDSPETYKPVRGVESRKKWRP
jgi:hypothetical protein